MSRARRRGLLAGCVAAALLAAPPVGAQVADAAGERGTAGERGAAEAPGSPGSPEAPVDTWYAHLASPGGKLPFVIELEEHPEGTRGFLVNGLERTPVPSTEWNGRRLRLGITHYGSVLELERTRDDPELLRGRWRRERAPGEVTEMAAEATRRPPARLVGRSRGPRLDGRWRVDFASDAQPAVGVFATLRGRLLGTFLTTTGDYRYLAGRRLGAHFVLSTFDGAHAFLFTGSLQADGSLRGDFWSRDTWHDTFTAVRDPQAALPDGFGLTRWEPGADVDELVFPDLEGTPRRLGDPAFAGKARLVQVFGSWCPNCHDASDLLADLHARYADQGLSIVGLAFEFSGDPERDAAQVRAYAERHGVGWPLLLAGTADKSAASAALPFLDAVRSYPTTLFVHADGRVRAVHQGFSGPATGADHAALAASFEALVQELLAEGD